MLHVSISLLGQCVEKMYIINSPLVFRSVWSMVSTMLTKRTKEKIAILGNESEYRKVLDELYANGIDDLPVCLGGKDTSCDFVNEQGPWSSILPNCCVP